MRPLVLGIVLLLSACSAHRVVPPEVPAHRPGTPSVPEFGVAVEKFAVRGGARGDRSRTDDYRRSFVQYLENGARFASLVDGEVRQDAGPVVRLDVTVDVRHSRRRTWLLDIPFFFPGTGVWPLTPLWGDAYVTVAAKARGPGEEVLWDTSVRRESGFWMLIYSWYRTKPIERAYAAASALAFTAFADELVANKDEILAKLPNAPVAMRRAEPPAAPPPRPVVPPPPVAPPPVAPPPPTIKGNVPRDWIIAIMDTQDLNANDATRAADPNLIRNLSDQLRIFMAERGARVVDRGQQKRALAELKVDSYKACFDESCQIPLGKALAASHILRTQVARFGGTCVLNGELLDLAKEITVTAASARADCSDEGFLDASQKLATKLLTR